MCHAIVYIEAWNKSNTLNELKERDNVMGIVAGTSVLVMGVTSILVRRFHYEVWYLTHITFYVLIVICVGMHRPDFSKRTVIVTIFIGCLWFSDRLLRLTKISIFSCGNTATITPLPHGGTHILLRKAPKLATPGKHCFLWIPKIRVAQTHPFTVASTENGFLSPSLSRHMMASLAVFMITPLRIPELNSRLLLTDPMEMYLTS